LEHVLKLFPGLGKRPAPDEHAGAPVAELRASCLVDFVGELEGPRVEALGFAEAFATLRLIRRARQRSDRGFEGRRLLRASNRPCYQARLLEVVRHELDELVFASRELSDPAREAPVQGGAPPLW